jgi:hypothetical protein
MVNLVLFVLKLKYFEGPVVELLGRPDIEDRFPGLDRAVISR